MTEFRELRPVARLYITLVALAGATVVAHSFYELNVNPVPMQWLILAALTLLTGSFTVKIPSISAHLSVSETFVFVSVLMFGAAAGTITVLLECLIILFWMKSSKPLHQILFNTAAPAIAIWFSATVFFAASGIEPYSRQVVPLGVLFIPLLAFTVLYFLLNSWLVAFALGFEISKSPVEIWRKNFTWLSVNYFSGASVAALIVTYTEKLDISLLVVIVPLLVVSYLTFRTAMGRVEDTNTHLSDLNRLYLSTIETLAMAIDAKDQITHGHIRRVQAYAVGLARSLGMTDEKLIKAIEAAALLHDMGKLAVPEYILNKPGKLTPAEFEKMKLHAGVGADILSAIDFPYPVVPIVRHHHENWDGTGYPTGIKGTDIPIGARILSVVDCFDALTSDRPYRPRLSDEEALKILAERRGWMYDPLIVDTFTRVYAEIAPHSSPTNVPREVLSEITSATQTVASNNLVPVDAPRDALEALTIYELTSGLAEPIGLSEAGDAVLKHVRRLLPHAQSVLFVYEVVSDEIVARQAMGDISAGVVGLRMALGQRLSGWVGANRQMIVNSDPVLDLGDVARAGGARLRSCLSAPLVSQGQLVGVLTLYSEAENGFTDADRRIVETVAREVGDTLRRAAEFDADAAPHAAGVPVCKPVETPGRYPSKAYR
jgi:putative nucleotidyltransferase with HDIG domain